MTPPPAAAPTTVADVLRTITRDPGRPRLTWYGPGGERIELSGHVLDNWVAKTVNLLVEEHDAGPGTVVLLDLPPHWRTVVWALAVWRCGACVALPPAEGSPEGVHVVVSARPEVWSAGTAEVLAVPLPALARRFDGALPPGATDAAAAVMGHGDAIGWAPATDDGAPALRTGGTDVLHGDLVRAAGTADASGTPGPEDRVLLTPAAGEVTDVLLTTLSVWAGDGSVVLCDPEVGTELAADPARLGRIVDGERVTRRATSA